MRTAESAKLRSSEALWERYSKIIEEYVSIGCTKVLLENVPEWAKDKSRKHGYEINDSGCKTTVNWDI